MKKNILLIVLITAAILHTNAQLANWTPGLNSAYTNFPVNVSGQINGFCRISEMKFHPTNANRLYAVTAEGGFFTSNDAGSNWTVRPCTETNTSSFASICIDRTNDQVIYLGSGDANYYSNGTGVYKSTDGGATMVQTTLTNCLVVEILQDPSIASNFVAATNKGIYKSTDNGNTWTAVTATNLPFCDLKQGFGVNNAYLFACTNDNNSRFFRSVDFGSTWTEITTGFTAATSFVQSGGRIGTTPADPNVVYFERIGGGGIIHKSVDGGLNFTLQKGQGNGTMANPYLTFYDFDNANGLNGQGNYNNCITVDVNDASKLWLQSHCTWYSTDNGVTWTRLTYWAYVLHTDMHQVIQSPFNANQLYSCNDGGIWVSTDGGTNWTPKSNGLYAYEIYNNCGRASNTDRNNITLGTQDNGRVYRTATGWFTDRGGDDTRQKEYDYLPNGGNYYEKTQNVKRAAGGGGSSSAGFPTSGNYWEYLAFNRSNTNLGFMWFTNNNLYRTTNLSSVPPTWTSVFTFTQPMRAMHSCVADPNRLYVITNDAKIHVSSNALAATPTFTTYNLPSLSGSLASITAIANNANTVYISINNKIYVSTNAGANWTDITYNLPNVNHRKILAEEIGGTQELVFVATNNAVYYKKAGQTSWTNYSTNLPARRAPTNFTLYDDGTAQSLLRYYSYGRAVFETQFSNLRGLSGSFTVNQKLYCTTGTPVTFSDNSTGNVTSWSWSFPGGTPSTSTAQNPVVTYSSPGLYGATLTVSDGVTTSTFAQGNVFLVMSSAPTVNTGCSISSNSNAGNGFGIGISSFSLANIVSNTSYNDGAYNDYSCSQWTTLTQGNTYNAAITTGTVNAEGAVVYIDLNNNGIFETTEAVITYPNNNSGTRTLSFTVPASGVTLNTGLRLRVVSRFNNVPANACNVSTYGQAEDYTVFILPVPSAVLSNGSGPASICAGQSANVKVNIVSGTSPYTVTLSNGVSNQVINNYTSGADIPVSPVTNTNYSLVSVTDYFGTSIPVSGAASVTLPVYSITASAGANGAISDAGTVSVTCGTNKTYTITPDAGYVVQQVLADGVPQGAISSYTFTNVTVTHTISASFIPACQPNTWTGATSTIWSVPGNWDCGSVPSAGDPITIPDVANDPVLDGNITTGNISIAAGATLSIGNNTLTLNGALSGTGTITGSATSNLVTTASTNLRFTPGANVLKNLTVSAGTATLANALDITGGLSAGNAGTVTVAPGAVLASGGNLIFKSNQYGTARLATGDIAGNYVTGEVTVERYIPDNGFRSWRLLSVPTYGSGQTIRQAWQEGLANPLPLQNNLPGFGTQITGTGLLATAQAAGFDNTAPAAALLSWGGTAWSNVATTNTPIASTKGYFMFIRGERTKGITGTNNNSSATTLRTKGLLYQGNQTSALLPANGFNLIGNLYPSAIDFNSLIRTGGVNNLFYVWDSKKQSGSSLGVYQTFSATNGFNCLISGGSFVFGQPNTVIESGQAFFVTTGNSTGTITLTEASKITSNGNAGFRPSNTLIKIDSRLYSVSGSTSAVVDANAVVFDKAYADAVDKEDALKLDNRSENFGIWSGNSTLAIEGRQPLNSNTVIQFRMWNMKQQQYKLEFVPARLENSGVTALLKDNYLHTFTGVDLSGSSSVYFTVTKDPGSAAPDRFSIVFKKTNDNTGDVSVPGFNILPNPTETNRVNIFFTDQRPGRYLLRLINNSGQLLVSRIVDHVALSSGYEMMLPPQMAAGTYQVEIIKK
jgi:hypothetical protein